MIISTEKIVMQKIIKKHKLDFFAIKKIDILQIRPSLAFGGVS